MVLKLLKFVIALALLPLLGLAWARLRARDREPDIPTKFSLGFGAIALGFWGLAGAIGAGLGIGCLLLAAAGWARGEAVVVPQWSKDMKWISERMDAVWDPWVAGA